MTALEVLRAARELISDEQHWTQGTAARDSEGSPVFTDSPDACRWCAVGALGRVSPGRIRGLHEALHRALPKGVFGISAFNDAYTHCDVLAFFDRAIAECES